MSRIGKLPVKIRKDVEVKIDSQSVYVKGPKGELVRDIPNVLSVSIDDLNNIRVERKSNEPQARALHGLYRVLIENMVVGVSSGFSKKLELVGVGFKAETKKGFLMLSIGYSHPIYFRPPQEVKVETPALTSVLVSGIDNELVGDVAAKIRSFRKPEPYQGKGIRYEDEVVRRKEGKSTSK